MSDIVERLRTPITKNPQTLRYKAADEIESLRSELVADEWLLAEKLAEIARLRDMNRLQVFTIEGLSGKDAEIKRLRNVIDVMENSNDGMVAKDAEIARLTAVLAVRDAALWTKPPLAEEQRQLKAREAEIERLREEAKKQRWMG